MPSPARLWHWLGVRSRVRILFVLSAALLALTVGLTIWTLSGRYLYTARQDAGVRQAQTSAAVVQRLLTPADRPDLPRQVRSLAEVNGSGVLVLRDGDVLASTGLAPGEVPPRVRRLVESGTRTRERVTIRGEDRLLVGIPLTGASYYQSLPLRELDDTMRTLRTALLVGGLVGVLLSALLAGLAIRGALRPIGELAGAAQAVARGELGTRMPETDRDLAELARVFNATTADLERRVRADARFASEVSHELRTPLTTMANALAVLERRRRQLPEVAQEAVDLLGMQVTRFQRLVIDLLDLAVLTEGQHAPTLQTVRVGALVRRLAVADGWGPVQADDAVSVRADPRMVERIVANLVRNAQTHGRQLVGVTVHRRGDVARIEVDDAGPGVPVHARQQVFERFARGEASGAGRPPGAGLGLALVAELTALHRGRTWVEDRPGGGARFVVELPLERA